MYRKKCINCYQTGLLYAVDLQIDFKVLFVCPCHIDNKREGFRMWNEKYNARYKLIDFPFKKFKPSDGKVESNKMYEIVAWWKKEKYNSLLYWESN